MNEVIRKLLNIKQDRKDTFSADKTVTFFFLFRRNINSVDKDWQVIYFEATVETSQSKLHVVVVT